jgi:hypothetical protein
MDVRAISEFYGHKKVMGQYETVSLGSAFEWGFEWLRVDPSTAPRQTAATLGMVIGVVSRGEKGTLST